VQLQVDRPNRAADIGRVLALCLLASAAAPARVVVVEARSDGAGPDVAAAVDAALGARLRTAGQAVVPAAEVAARMKARPDLRGCTRSECLDKTAALLGATRLLGGTVRKDGASLAVEVWVYDPAAHASVTGKSACTSCGAERARDLAAAALADALARDALRFVPATIEVSSQPSGATVELDGHAAGVTPLRLRVPAGSHGLAILKEGYVGQTRDVDADGGAAIDLHFALDPAAAPPLWPGYKWLAWGGAIVAVAAGATLVAIDGNDVGPVSGAEGREVRATRTPGIVLVGIGVALGATGTTLWWLE
jgi:PEGA domain-containing protein